MNKMTDLITASRPTRLATVRTATLGLITSAFILLGGCAHLPGQPGAQGSDTASNTSQAAQDDGRTDSDMTDATPVDYSVLPAMGDQKRGSHPATWRDDGNLWHYIAARFQLKIPHNHRIDEQRAFYAKHIHYLERVTERAEPYLHMIVADLQKKNLPLELALLPIVESAYRPEALSSSKAAGLWQFVPATGTHFGLDRTAWYDGRRDIKQSTDAAVRYFTILRQMFNDNWPVIIAAYNGGEGTLQRAIEYNQRHNRPTDFWHLTRISNETRAYPAKLYALAEIFSHPAKYGFKPFPIPNKPVVAEIKLTKPVNLGKLAKLTGVSHGELCKLNPGFDRLITGPKARNLLIPRSKADQFKPSILTACEQSASDWARYTIVRGDSFHKIAWRFGSSVDELLRVNRLQSSYAQPGETILVPTGRVKDRPVPANSRTYTVRSGDSLWSISRKFHVHIARLKRYNALVDHATLHPGQKLIVGRLNSAGSGHTEVASSSGGSKGTYTVTPGDSLWSIAQRMSTTVAALAQANHIDKNHALRPGDTLVIPGQAGTGTASSTPAVAHNGKRYVVKPGDTLWQLAREFSMTVAELTAKNNIRKDAPLKPGQELIVASR